MRVLLEIQYLPCLQYFSKILVSDGIIIDDKETFGRQSYRNRCYIASANGRIPLVVPAKRSRSGFAITDIEIDNTGNWQHIHWQSIQSAYGKAAFFEYYADYFKPFYKKNFDKLFDFDFQLLQTIFKLLKIPHEKISLLSQTGNDAENEIENCKDRIHPKTTEMQNPNHFPALPYMQVFMEKHGFIPNLSILDLLFCEGPNASEWIKINMPK